MGVSFGPTGEERSVKVQAGPVVLEGDLGLPPGAHGVVLFAHGSGSGRKSSRTLALAVSSTRTLRPRTSRTVPSARPRCFGVVPTTSVW